jgi:hypothetical protein
MIRQIKLELKNYWEVGKGRDYVAGYLCGNMRLFTCLVMLADVMISLFFNNHKTSVLALLTAELHNPPKSSLLKFYPLPSRAKPPAPSF